MNKNKSIIEISTLLPLIIACRIFYELIGKYNSQGERDYAHLLLLEWDSMIPYVPVFVIPYLSIWVYPLVLVAIYIYIYSDSRNSTINYIRASYFSAFILMLVCYSIYVLFPTYVLFPVLILDQVSPNATQGLLDSLIHWTYRYISMWNAFPSAHVAFPYLFWLIMMTVVKDISRWIYFIYFLIISLSVVFIRIHYLVDILGGIIIGQVIYTYCFLPLWRSQYLLKKSPWIFIFFYYSFGLIAIFLCQIYGPQC
jgi:membrane-associated phospholipid phosphatase